MQAYAAGEVKDVNEARSIVRNSFEIKKYAPDTSDTLGWQKAYEKFCKLIEK
jgi:hypothetical protein